MAYDKVVDSAVLDAGLKQIADAIREKGGTSDNLAFPQAMVEAIKAIEAGGGGCKVTHGRVTPVETVEFDGTTPYTIAHGLGEKPDFVIIMKTATITTTKTISGGVYIGAVNDYQKEMGVLFGAGQYATTGVTLPTSPKNFGKDGYLKCSADETNINILGESSYKFVAQTYTWVAGVLE
jgi:hypothetical protein